MCVELDVRVGDSKGASGTGGGGDRAGSLKSEPGRRGRGRGVAGVCQAICGGLGVLAAS